MQSRGEISQAACAGTGGAGIFRGELEGLWLRGNVERGVRIGDAGIGARRFGSAQFRVGAIFAGDVSDLRFRLGRAKRQVAAADAARQNDRLLRTGGAPTRIRTE